MDEIDIWRAAETLLKRYGGERAALMAAMRTEELLDQGDLVGFDTWKRIVKVINKLERTTRGGGESLN